MSVASLSEDLILLVCLELPLEDITSLRQVCRVLYAATQAKILWIGILKRETPMGMQILPPYLKTYDLLDTAPLEALVRRTSTLARKWETRDLSPIGGWRLYLPQSITWLRFVAGSWLFVASSDNHSSKLSCWDLSLFFQGYVEPVAEAYLPGQVKTGKLEIQDSGVVLALGLGAESRSVHIITLRQSSGGHSFSELCRIEGSSHVLMLTGDFVGCALRHDTIVPHIINWKEKRIHDIPPPPGGLDMPGRRSVPHLMTVWGNILVIFRSNALEFYTLSPATGGSVIFLKLVVTPTVWEAAVCDSQSTSSTRVPPLRLMTISPIGIELYVIEYDTLANDDEYLPFCLGKPPRSATYQDPWYHLCVGQTGGRAVCISASEEWIFGSDPHFICMKTTLSPSDDAATPFIVWKDDEPGRPALWALPAVDFDDALGIIVIGNCFGELAIYDHGGGHPERCAGLATDFTDQQSSLPPLLPTIPIPLDLTIVPRAASRVLEHDASIISRWSLDDIDLDDIWSTDWFSGYWDWDLWQGALADLAWRVEHQYGFPGPAIPQAYMDDLNNDLQHLLFRSGNRYFLFTLGSEPELRSWPDAPPPRAFIISEAQPEYSTRRTAITEGNIYRGMHNHEMMTVRRNRWIEQAERGGQPHPNLLFMPPIHTLPQ
ncbi:hypothetical protein FB451DRAFT_1552360 [Mycena latifolia]|nr:hypothetical protein FB451DRAFT_1552360 [Mycena latifolia]